MGQTLVRSRYDARNRVLAVIEGESMTEQCHGVECDINTIVGKAVRTGMMPLNTGSPLYGDFSQVGDYQTACNAVLDAQSAFEALPADIRARFKNNPAELIAFLQDEKNREEAVKLGLVSAQVVEPGVSESPKADATSPDKGSPASK